MKQKVVFAGFRHNHIFTLLEMVKKHPALELVACAEEDAATRKQLAENGKVEITHDSISKMLDEIPCDIVAIGDAYARRGKIAIEALKRGKHIVSDKPLCTTLAELDEIEVLAEKNKLSVGCMFDLRTTPSVANAKNILDSGVLGDIVQIQFSAQHPLLRGSRPGWYFAGDMHGGTINDIGSHAADLIPFLVGSPISEIVAARTWKALAAPEDNILDAGQFMFTLANGCGVMGDVSYSSPDSQGYTMPTYWRFNIWGKNGMIEFNYHTPEVTAFINGYNGKTIFAPPADYGKDFLTEFLDEISGTPGSLTTASNITAARWILKMQQMSEQK